MIADHLQRYQLANELHARPFPFHSAPGMVAFLALKEPEMQRREIELKIEQI